MTNKTLAARTKSRRVGLFALLVLIPLVSPVQAAEPSANEFNWYELAPSENLTWTTCYEGQQCARLSLPLDHERPDGPKTHIAIRMIPATDRENYKGPILLNPGGPGGSGTAMIGDVGTKLAQVLGPEFDLIGFDPRGVGATVPLAQCFDSKSQQQWDQAVQGDVLLVDLKEDTIRIKQSRMRLIAERCLQTIGGNGTEDANGTAEEWGPGRFMSTPYVATDMLRIVEQFGQDKLQYWGFSYGTVLGQYFAAMYPDRVGRLVIDGVADAELYSRGLWDENLVDTDKVIQSFYTYCHQAGKEKCELYESTAKGVEQRFHRILESLKASPLVIPAGNLLITKGLVQQFLFRQAAYYPADTFRISAKLLYAIETNNLTGIQDAVKTLLPTDPAPQPWEAPTQAANVISGGDVAPLQEKPEETKKYFDRLYDYSAFAAPFWAELHSNALEWKIPAKKRYTGPFAANTSHPILIAQPTYDPVCPMVQAKRVQKRYSNAGLLEQKSFGHCTTSAPSTCTAKYIRAYFVNRTLPKEGTVCEPDVLPFIGEVEGKVQQVEDRELLDALQNLKRAVPFYGPH